MGRKTQSQSRDRPGPETWAEKDNVEGQTWGWKEISEEPMPHGKKKRCLVKESFCQMKGSKDEKFQIKAACVTLAQSYLGYFYHNSHSD